MDVKHFWSLGILLVAFEKFAALTLKATDPSEFNAVKWPINLITLSVTWERLNGYNI